MTPKTWDRLQLKYSTAIAIIHALDEGFDLRVLVVGDPDNGGYEWVIEKNGHVEKHSDLGYGNSTVALRDGLIAYHGLPRSAGLSEERIKELARTLRNPRRSQVEELLRKAMREVVEGKAAP